MDHDEVVTRRLIAAILGVLGLVVLVDVAVIGVVSPDASFDGFRQMLLVIVGGLLICGGAITFAWPHRGSVETPHEGSDGGVPAAEPSPASPPDPSPPSTSAG